MTPHGVAGRHRSVAGLALIGLLAAIICAGLVALGIWQIERRTWKHALIAQVAAGLHAVPTDSPEPKAWPAISAASAYRRVHVRGHWTGSDTLVQASTRLGPGWWAIRPLRTDRGFTILVNRGFVPSRTVAAVPSGTVALVGLLRISEPKGRLLRSNDPVGGRWYSRDVAAIAATQRVDPVAPYFIDADAASSPPGGPTGGLTVIDFPDNHLVYALTWFGLALLVAGGYALLVRDAWRAKSS